MYKYKLAAIDCDNTLLDSTAHISEENKQVINELSEQGVRFILTTGRNDILVYDYLLELNIGFDVIGCNGASIRNLESEKIYRLTGVSKEALREIYSYCSRNEITLNAFSLTHCYSNRHMTVDNTLSQIIPTYTKKLSREMKYECHEDMLSVFESEDILKVIVINNNPDILHEIQEGLRKVEGVNIVRSARVCIDIMNTEATKGGALKYYAQMHGIKPEEIIAVGDSENDCSMLKYAGFAVAMANGEDCVKQLADFVTDTNNAAGVAKALKHIF